MKNITSNKPKPPVIIIINDIYEKYKSEKENYNIQEWQLWDALVALPCLKLIQKKIIHLKFYLTLQNKTTKFFQPNELFKKFGFNLNMKLY